MRREASAFTLGILLAAGCGGGSGSTADASAQTGTTTTTTSQVDAPQSGPESGGTATNTGISATVTATGTGTGATVTATGTGTGATATATGTGTGATATVTGTGTSATATKTTTAISATVTGTGTATSATATKTATATSATTTATGTGTGGTATKTTTAISATATGTGTGTGGTGACNVPLCLNDLVSSCIPDGACVQQLGYMCGAVVCPQPLTAVPTSMFNYMCFDNGVTVSTTVDMTNPASQTSVQTCRKNGTVCYSVEMPLSLATGTSMTEIVKNPAGATVATEVFDQTARTVTITCTGGSPAVVSLDCFTSSSRDGGTPCTTGTCSP